MNAEINNANVALDTFYPDIIVVTWSAMLWDVLEAFITSHGAGDRLHVKRDRRQNDSISVLSV